MGGYKRLRALAKKKRRLELLTMACAATGVAVLVSVFYLILNR